MRRIATGPGAGPLALAALLCLSAVAAAEPATGSPPESAPAAPPAASGDAAPAPTPAPAPATGAPPLAPAGAACRDAPADAAPAAAAADPATARAQAAFALDLLRALAGDTPGPAAISASPSGVAATLSALALGADAPMRGAIARTLHLPEGRGEGRGDGKGRGEAEAGLAGLRAALSRLGAARADAPVHGADALFVDAGLTVKPGILRLLAKARLPVRRASLDTAEGVKAVNAFVSEATAGLIPTILDGPVGRTALAAVSAFHFRDCWRVAFDPSATAAAPFLKPDGSRVTVPTMHLRNQRMPFAVAARFAAVELAYRDPEFVMALVTTTDAPAGPEAFGPAAPMLAGEGFQAGAVDLALPAFGVQDTHDLLGPLAGLGLGAGLASPTALSRFADGLRLSAVRQKTVVAVDENGTVAAAATAALATRSAAVSVQRIAFDRPFVFALRHRPTGLLLMTGYVGEPRPAPGR